MSDATRLRLSVFLPSLVVGGAERATVNLCNGLAARGVAVELVLVGAFGPFLADVDPALTVVDLHCRHVVAALPRLARYLRRARPDLLLAGMSHANVAAVLARDLSRTHTPVVVTEHIHFSVFHAHEPSLRHSILPRAMRATYPRADGIIAVSEGVQHDLAEFLHLPLQAVDVAYNPIVTPELLESRHEAPHPWLDDGGDPVVVAVGRLVPQKDYATLIRAIARVGATQPVRLLILGEGDERPTLEAAVTRAGLDGRVTMPGNVAHPASSVARAGAYVLSSKYEGLPSVLIEALPCGVPIVATDCPSGPREILDGGRHGRLVPVGDDAALADALVAALRGDVEPPAADAWADYTTEATTSRYLSILGAIIASNR